MCFDGRRTLMFDDIHKAFVQECRPDGGVSNNALRLAHLCVVYGILLMKDRTSKKIDLKYIHLIDDFDVAFREFPWGRVAYEFLVGSTHNARRCIFRLMSRERSLSCEAHGFPQALLIWAYEVLPRLGLFAAIPRDDMMIRMPRMLRWKVDCYYGFEAMQPLFQPVTGATPVPMVPSAAEARMLTDLGLPSSIDDGLVPSNGSKRKRKLNFSPGDEPKKTQPLKNARIPRNHIADRVKSTLPQDDDDIPYFHHSPAASRSPGSPKVDAAVHSVSDANDTILVMNEVLRRITCMEQDGVKRHEQLEARVLDMLRTSMGVDMPPCLKRCLFCGCKNGSEDSNKENEPPVNNNRPLTNGKEKVVEGASNDEIPSSSHRMAGILCDPTANYLPISIDSSPKGVLDFKDQDDSNSFLLDLVWNPSLLKNESVERGESVDKGEPVEKDESVEKDVSKVTPFSRHSSVKMMPSSAPPRASTPSYRIGMSVPGSAPPRRSVNDVEEVVISIFDPNDMD